jgi:hypothetical protein
MEHANIGDIVELSNGLKLRLDFDNDKKHFKTVDIFNELDITTNYPLKDLKHFAVGNSIWGYGTETYKIINIAYQEDGFLEIKSEVLYIIDNALNVLQAAGGSNKYYVPNGSVWTYDEVRHFLIKHIKM